MTIFSLAELFVPCASRRHAFPMDHISQREICYKTSGKYDFLGRLLIRKNVNQNVCLC